MKKQTAKNGAYEWFAKQEYSGQSRTSIDGFIAGVRWERARRRREEREAFKKSPAYALHKALDEAEKAPKRKINLIAKGRGK